MAVETMVWRATAPGSGGATGILVQGCVDYIREMGVETRLLGTMGVRQVSGDTLYKSSLFHDTSASIRHAIMGAAGVQIRQLITTSEIEANDKITTTLTGSATAGDIELSALNVLYKGIGNFITYSELKRRAIDMFTPRVTLPTVTTGEFGTRALIVSTDDYFKAGNEYAVLGVTVLNDNVFGVRMENTADWVLPFVLPNLHRMGMFGDSWAGLVATFEEIEVVPVMKAENKTSTYLQVIGNENLTGSVTGHVTLIRLSKGRK